MTLQRSDFRFFHRLRVRWAEVDMQHIVFNAHYLMYLDTAMGDYWRALALPYQESMVLLGGDMYVKKSTLEYHASARYDDTLHIGLRCARVGNSSMVFEGGIFRGDTLLVSGELLYVFADPTSQTSRPVPDALRQVFAQFEAGQAVTHTAVGKWDDWGNRITPLRRAVFVDEQAISEVLVWDEADASAVHAVVHNVLGQVVASGRMVVEATGVARIGRMATHQMLRGGGLGLLVLRALVQAARQRGDTEVMLHAQCSAEGFYLGEGFARRGEVFVEAGIAHQEMALVLAA
ncbi:YbgC/YbaW family acyl-CoA thioester hydrolase [Rhodoferax saidenbachensis]|uniref:YbgC/YbaW family acyl-CoA thioester hydrolase n=1 Tax=Rhodoferax saidenbachensis TaxID=1484693 RepID=A0ABU1ZK03_9BURK|nr:YbgC/YbaW family acyl-CoA thioester hydrolase [Rhodoferax saidenbachensis]